MKSFRTRIAAILIVAAMGITMTACSSSDESSVDSASGESAVAADNGDNNGAAEATVSAGSDAADNGDVQAEIAEGNTDFLKQEITFGMEPGLINGDGAQDPTEAPQQTQAPQTYIVTRQVVVTEAGGKIVTDAKGQNATEVVTEVKQEEVPYVPAPMSQPVYWLDMTKGANGEYDKVFNGDIMTIEFKIKEGTPDGNYPIVLNSADFVNWEEEQLDVKTVGSYITVGDAVPSAAEQVQPGQFTVYSTSDKGNVGDTVKVVLNISDNPGLVGLLFRVEFDSNALEYVTSYSGSALAGFKNSAN